MGVDRAHPGGTGNLMLGIVETVEEISGVSRNRCDLTFLGVRVLVGSLP